MTESDQLEAFPDLLRLGQRQLQRKPYLKEFADRGENWALHELEDLRRAERAKNKAAYERFKARRRPEVLRAKWRTAKAALRAAKAEAEVEAKRQREIEESAAQAAAAAAENAEREQKALVDAANGGTLRELQVVRLVANPRLILCAYWQDGKECRCLVNVGRNGNFVPRMTLRLTEPADSAARSRPWPYAGPLPRRKGRW
jgi:hypothetical protein